MEQAAHTALLNSPLKVSGPCCMTDTGPLQLNSSIGVAESLARETSHLGIRVHVMVLGLFRTGILSPQKKTGNLDPTGISDYSDLKSTLAARHHDSDGKQPGDPAIAAQRMVDVVRLENLPEQQTDKLPIQIPLGTDALSVIKAKCTGTLDTIRVWEQFAASTNYEDSAAIAKYG